MKDPSHKNIKLSLAFWIGIGCILTGMFFSRWTIGQLLTVGASYPFSTVIRSVALVIEATVIAFGLYLVIRRPTLSLARVLLLFGSSSLTVLVVALLFQIFYSPPRVTSGWRAHTTPAEQNQMGYRGHPIAYTDEDYVILLVGDSQVEAAACAFDYLPESRLEYYLTNKGKKVKVFSVGAGGYGQDQQLLALREYFGKYRASLVLLWETPDNDIWNNIFPTHWPTNANPKPTFWLEKGRLEGPTEQIGEELPYPAIKVLSLFSNFTTYISQRDTMWEKRLPTAYKPLNEFKGSVNYDWQHLWDANAGIMRRENLDIEKSHFAIRLTPRSDRMEYGLELTRRLLKEIEKLVLVSNGRLITFVVSTPIKPGPDEQVYVLNGKYYRTSEHQFRENLNYINAEFKTIDVHVNLEKWRVGPADAHLNEHATDEAMMNLSNMLEQAIPNP